MSTFALREVDEVRNGKLSFYKLVMDDVCLYDDFCKEIEKNTMNLKSLNSIRAYMNFMAENNSKLPATKFNSILENNKVIGYKFKKDSLRVYVLKKDPNIYIILGGYKKNQKEDIKKFIRIKKEYEKYI